MDLEASSRSVGVQSPQSSLDGQVETFSTIYRTPSTSTIKPILEPTGDTPLNRISLTRSQTSNTARRHPQNKQIIQHLLLPQSAFHPIETVPEPKSRSSILQERERRAGVLLFLPEKKDLLKSQFVRCVRPGHCRRPLNDGAYNHPMLILRVDGKHCVMALVTSHGSSTISKWFQGWSQYFHESELPIEKEGEDYRDDITVLRLEYGNTGRQNWVSIEHALKAKIESLLPHRRWTSRGKVGLRLTYESYQFVMRKFGMEDEFGGEGAYLENIKGREGGWKWTMHVEDARQDDPVVRRDGFLGNDECEEEVVQDTVDIEKGSNSKRWEIDEVHEDDEKQVEMGLRPGPSKQPSMPLPHAVGSRFNRGYQTAQEVEAAQLALIENNAASAKKVVLSETCKSSLYPDCYSSRGVREPKDLPGLDTSRSSPPNIAGRQPIFPPFLPVSFVATRTTLSSRDGNSQRDTATPKSISKASDGRSLCEGVDSGAVSSLQLQSRYAPSPLVEFAQDTYIPRKLAENNRLDNRASMHSINPLQPLPLENGHRSKGKMMELHGQHQDHRGLFQQDGYRGQHEPQKSGPHGNSSSEYVLPHLLRQASHRGSNYPPVSNLSIAPPLVFYSHPPRPLQNIQNPPQDAFRQPSASMRGSVSVPQPPTRYPRQALPPAASRLQATGKIYSGDSVRGMSECYQRDECPKVPVQPPFLQQHERESFRPLRRIAPAQNLRQCLKLSSHRDIIEHLEDTPKALPSHLSISTMDNGVSSNLKGNSSRPTRIPKLDGLMAQLTPTTQARVEDPKRKASSAIRSPNLETRPVAIPKVGTPGKKKNTTSFRGTSTREGKKSKSSTSKSDSNQVKLPTTSQHPTSAVQNIPPSTSHDAIQPVPASAISRKTTANGAQQLTANGKVRRKKIPKSSSASGSASLTKSSTAAQSNGRLEGLGQEVDHEKSIPPNNALVSNGTSSSSAEASCLSVKPGQKSGSTPAPIEQDSQKLPNPGPISSTKKKPKRKKKKAKVVEDVDEIDRALKELDEEAKRRRGPILYQPPTVEDCPEEPDDVLGGIITDGDDIIEEIYELSTHIAWKAQLDILLKDGIQASLDDWGLLEQQISTTQRNFKSSKVFYTASARSNWEMETAELLKTVFMQKRKYIRDTMTLKVSNEFRRLRAEEPQVYQSKADECLAWLDGLHSVMIGLQPLDADKFLLKPISRDFPTRQQFLERQKEYLLGCCALSYSRQLRAMIRAQQRFKNHKDILTAKIIEDTQLLLLESQDLYISGKKDDVVSHLDDEAILNYGRVKEEPNGYQEERSGGDGEPYSENVAAGPIPKAQVLALVEQQIKKLEGNKKLAPSKSNEPKIGNLEVGGKSKKVNPNANIPIIEDATKPIIKSQDETAYTEFRDDHEEANFKNPESLIEVQSPAPAPMAPEIVPTQSVPSKVKREHHPEHELPSTPFTKRQRKLVDIFEQGQYENSFGDFLPTAPISVILPIPQRALDSTSEPSNSMDNIEMQKSEGFSTQQDAAENVSKFAEQHQATSLDEDFKQLGIRDGEFSVIGNSVLNDLPNTAEMVPTSIENNNEVEGEDVEGSFSDGSSSKDSAASTEGTSTFNPEESSDQADTLEPSNSSAPLPSDVLGLLKVAPDSPPSPTDPLPLNEIPSSSLDINRSPLEDNSKSKIQAPNNPSVIIPKINTALPPTSGPPSSSRANLTPEEQSPSQASLPQQILKSAPSSRLNRNPAWSPPFTAQTETPKIERAVPKPPLCPKPELPSILQPPSIAFGSDFIFPNPLYGLYIMRAKFLLEHPDYTLKHEHRLVSAYLDQLKREKQDEENRKEAERSRRTYRHMTLTAVLVVSVGLTVTANKLGLWETWTGGKGREL